MGKKKYCCKSALNLPVTPTMWPALLDPLPHLAPHYAIPVEGREEGMPLHLLRVV